MLKESDFLSLYRIILLKKKNRLNCLTVGEMKAKALVEDGHNSHGGVSNPRPPDVGAEQASSTSQSKFINSAVN